MQILKKSMAALLACAMLLTLLPAAALAVSAAEDTPDAAPADEPVAALADVYSGVCGERNEDGSFGDNISWSINTNTRILSISGSGRMADFTAFADIPWGNHRAYVNQVIVSGGITYLGRGAFEFLPNLERATLADSITSTGNYVFYSDTALQYVSLPASLTDLAWGTFRGCSSLASSTVPAACTNLHGEAYYECTALKTVSIPDGVKIIGNNAFYGCEALETVIFAGSQKSWAAIDVGTGNEPLLAANISKTGEPANVENVTASVENKTIVVKWNAALNCESYNVYRKRSDTDLAPIASNVQGTTYTDTTASAGVQYYYSVKGVNGIAESPDFASVAAASWSAAPANVKMVSAVAGADSITVNWEEVSNAVSYRVYRKVSGGTTGWKTLTSAATGSSYVDTTAAAGTTYIYTVRAIDADGTLSPSYDKTGVSAKIENALAVTAQPADVTADAGTYAYFTVAASGSSLTYQWQYQAPGGDWKNSAITGNKSATLKVYTYASRNGWAFRCIVTDAAGNTVTSDAAVLTIKAAIQITAQPEDAVANAGAYAYFTVAASGTGLTYQWQYQAPGSTKWTNTTLSGNKTATLKVGATAGRDGYSYRCVITDASGNSVKSDAGVLTVKSGPAITAQPADITVNVGETAKFTVAATGTGLTYQWQYKSPTGTKWASTSLSGNKTAALSVAATAGRDGFSYRCKVTDSAGNVVYSDAAVLTVKSGPVITAQPADVTVNAGSYAYFTVTASGSGLTYQWQYQAAGSTKWTNTTLSGNKTATLKVAASSGRNGYSYRCVITDANGNSVNSGAAVLTVN